jgi:hypothetical protein
MTMERFVIGAVVSLVTLAAVPAHAAEPWSAPQTVSSAGGQIQDARVVVDGTGRAIATWTSVGPIPDVKTGYPVSGGFAFRDPGAVGFGPELSGSWPFTAAVLYGRNRVLALNVDWWEVNADFGDTTGKLDFTQPVGTFEGGTLLIPSLAVHRTAVAAWIENPSLGRQRVRASIRPLGGSFGTPVTLRRGRDLRAVVAASGPGVVFVAWERGDAIEARVKRSGHRWGPVRRVGASYSDPSGVRFETAFSGRRAYLAWLAPNVGQYTLRAAALPRGRTRFRRAQGVDVVEQELKPYSRAIALVPLPHRGALLGWTGWDGKQARAWAARTGRNARFGRKVSVAPAGEPAVLGDLAVGGDGSTVLAVWTRLDDRGVGDRVRAALRQRGGAFGPPEDVSDLDRANLSVDSAYDPVGRRWTVVWGQTIGPAFVPDYMAATYLRAATRPG